MTTGLPDPWSEGSTGEPRHVSDLVQRAPIDGTDRRLTVSCVERTDRVLVLNSSSEPLHLIAVGRAISLVVGERAVIVSHAGQMRSERRSYPRPTVIRLSRYVHIPWRQPQLSLKNLSLRDSGLCQWCRKQPGETIDHVTPRARRGPHTWENVVLACRGCNNKKSDSLASELGWALQRAPYVPTRRELMERDPRVASRAVAAAG